MKCNKILKIVDHIVTILSYVMNSYQAQLIIKPNIQHERYAMIPRFVTS